MHLSIHAVPVRACNSLIPVSPLMIICYVMTLIFSQLHLRATFYARHGAHSLTLIFHCALASTRRATGRRTACRAGPGSTQYRHCRRPRACAVRLASTLPTRGRPTAWRALQVRTHAPLPQRQCLLIPAVVFVTICSIPLFFCTHLQASDCARDVVHS